jgi:hypothetical protein
MNRAGPFELPLTDYAQNLENGRVNLDGPPSAGGLGTAPKDSTGTVSCVLGSVNSFAKTWTSDKVSGVKCLDKTAVAGNKTVTVTVAVDGGMSCAFS